MSSSTSPDSHEDRLDALLHDYVVQVLHTMLRQAEDQYKSYQQFRQYFDACHKRFQNEHSSYSPLRSPCIRRQ